MGYGVCRIWDMEYNYFSCTLSLSALFYIIIRSNIIDYDTQNS